MSAIAGIHHVTAFCGSPQPNVDFYRDVLGLRLVKLTVNYDDPATYHLYYGDDLGRPGTIMTFFPWPGANRGRVGNGQVSATAFAVPKGSSDFWKERIDASGVEGARLSERFGEKVVSFVDPDGLPLEVIETTPAMELHAHAYNWVAKEHSIRGFHSVSLGEEGYETTANLLTDQMGFTLVGSEGNRFRYRGGGQDAGGIVDVLCQPDARRGSTGVGTVHHVAFRSANLSAQEAWRKKFVDARLNVTPIVDRTYFKSIYFREPGGVLFEVATDDPGFAVDEPVESLGSKLVLPKHLESQRPEIEAVLPPIDLSI